MFPTSKNASFQAEVLSQARFFSHRLEDFLAPFLVQLDRLLDHRLVLTFQALCQALVRHRSRSSGLLLSELGGVLLSPHKAPAGTKRLSNLLRSKKWSAEAITDYLTGEAQTYVDRLLEQERELPLLLWDESVQEKTESLKSQGLCAVRSMKAKRTLRIKPGICSPMRRCTRIGTPGGWSLPTPAAGRSSRPSASTSRRWAWRAAGSGSGTIE
ncbi:hypothetical protein K3G39_15065 [Pontibacter sp. HSC-14F20]|uniref:hypothetical protein n=1 Tax=Pontibacter sp. HSC-14F20 TaxID=2864136 RepID=UPI001C73B6ED|nr:hypothetical protein [Pontibacter sp. HSC-14F20]MBX0334561.1 hypothetical protein [Pontibacter sp. HSC-14F20]